MLDVTSRRFDQISEAAHSWSYDNTHLLTVGPFTITFCDRINIPRDRRCFPVLLLYYGKLHCDSNVVFLSVVRCY